jgi:TolB-like protein
MTFGGGGLAAALLIGVVFGRDIYTTLFPKHDHVAVLRLEGRGLSKDMADFADGLTDEIGYVLKQGQIPTVTGKLAETLRGSDRDGQSRRYQVGAILDGTVSGDANLLKISLHIDDPVHRHRVWSHDFQGSGDDLQTQVSSRVINILTCSARALKAGAAVSSPETESLYLKFCDLDSDAASDAAALAEEERVLRELTVKAPQFSYGHSSLALFLFSKSQVDPANTEALRAEAAKEADKALALDARNSDGYAARARLVSSPGWAEREKNLALAVSLPGAGPLTNAIYALMLGEVGRLGDAAVYAQRLASEDTSGDPDYVILIANSLAAQGKDDDADRALTKALEIAPNNPVIQAFRYHMYQWFGRWAEAAPILEDEANRPALLAQEEDLGASRAFINAMVQQDAASKAAARDAEYASVAHDRSHLMAALSHLSALGLVDDAYRLAAQVPPSAQADDLSVLFTPLAVPMRRDPRFIALAGKLGLVSYWSTSGKWPDFCAAADLPYNCRAEAKKLGAG